MAMLAEPRRKTKWTLNPRGKLWSEDPNNYGKKLLEKMGWKEGKGLGANEQGRTSHINVQVKGDNTGVGFKGKDMDWCKHQAQFEEVLANLSQNMGGGVGGSEPSESLEDLSKSSRARLHYKKFTREKDVSKYTSKELGCILGVSNDKLKGQSNEKVCPVEDVGAKDDSFGVKTVIGGSITDYLNRKKVVKNLAGNEDFWGESSGQQKKVEEVKDIDTTENPDGTPALAVPGCSASDGENYKGNSGKVYAAEHGDLGESSKSAFDYAVRSAPDSTSELEGLPYLEGKSRCYSATTNDSSELNVWVEGGVSQSSAIFGSTGKRTKKRKKLNIEELEIVNSSSSSSMKCNLPSIPDSTNELEVNSIAHLNEVPAGNGGEQYRCKKKRMKLCDGDEASHKICNAAPSLTEFLDGNVPDSTTEPKGVSLAYLEEENKLSLAGTVDEMLEIMVLGGLSNKVAHHSQTSVKGSMGKTNRCYSEVLASEKVWYQPNTNEGETREHTTYTQKGTVHAAGCPDTAVRRKKKKSAKSMCSVGSKIEMSSGNGDKKMSCDCEVETCNANGTDDGDVVVLDEVKIPSESRLAKLKVPISLDTQVLHKNKSKITNEFTYNAHLSNKETDEVTICASSKLFSGANLDKVKGYGRFD